MYAKGLNRLNTCTGALQRMSLPVRRRTSRGQAEAQVTVRCVLAPTLQETLLTLMAGLPRPCAP